MQIQAEAKAEVEAPLSAAPLHAVSEPRRSVRPSVWRTIRRQRLAMTGVILVTIFILIAFFGPLVAPFSPTKQFSEARMQPPSAEYRLGTDEYGRDILSRLLYGARISFQVGAIAVLLAGVTGILLGLIAGYRGGWVDNVLILVMDVIFAFPAILLAIAIISLLGNDITNAMIAIAIVYMPTFMRIVRGAVLSVKHMAYIEAAVSLGLPTTRILARHVLPNITAPLIVHSTLVFAFIVLAEASLSFLGLGNKPPAPSWGSMVSASYGFLQLAPWAAVFPGIAIALTVLGFNLLGDGIRDALDPRLRT